MGFRIFEISPKYRVLRSDDPALVLNRGYDAYVYTGLVPATWILPLVSSRFSKIDVTCDPAAAQLDVQVQDGQNQIKNPVPTNSLIVFPGVSFSLINDKAFWLVRT